MKVILLQDVEGLGKAGDLKEVANGYARNYLLPRNLAAGATPSLIANRQQRIAAEQRKQEKQAENPADGNAGEPIDPPHVLDSHVLFRSATNTKWSPNE